uniref:Major facilitator superfamily (MFS) profile domain-containing protein n=1 Tax=Myripristis murdjan TaxID=586833 RepID=A0A667YNJ9_9TELE
DAAPPPPRPLDGGWGWAVVAAGFTAMLLVYGSPQSVGVLYPEWLLVYQEGKSRTAWVGSVVSGVGMLIGPVCSACVVNFGARPATVFSGVMVSGGLMLSAFAPNIPFLIFSYSIVVGIGAGLLYASVITITCLYFDKRRGLALGIVITGSSVGGFVYATLQTVLVDWYGLEGCLLVIGALALNIVACAGPMRPLAPPKYYLKQRAAMLEQRRDPSKESKEKEPIKPANEKPPSHELQIAVETREPLAGRSGVFGCSALIRLIKSNELSATLALLRDKVLVAFCVSLFLFSFGAFPPQLFLEDLAQSEGLAEGVADVSLVSLNSMGSCVGKLALGVMVDLPGVNSVFLYASTVAVSALGLLLIPLTRTYLGLQVLSVLLGLMSGNWSLTPYVVCRLVGVDKMTEASGMLMLFGGVGIILGPPFFCVWVSFTMSTVVVVSVVFNAYCVCVWVCGCIHVSLFLSLVKGKFLAPSGSDNKFYLSIYLSIYLSNLI